MVIDIQLNNVRLIKHGSVGEQASKERKRIPLKDRLELFRTPASHLSVDCAGSDESDEKQQKTKAAGYLSLSGYKLWAQTAMAHIEVVLLVVAGPDGIGLLAD
ncbi:unnamed protein product [Didymodactylos carnosus]|uniref:Uncharacterized protein n=1 Tax=Didymodactylos carnosus TaxID=1234261 RepID=A0A815NYX8_9BILA|nr:unnamed protein product [Didymodactylos carnosus]CAF1442496.1 unnamed protein product [Didymodactylos carnosus]CAF3770204.1 unnamed protein product [Didymodactylos carnosus]CAF4318076.1 unnamed protein product [Didymodactylos carnosus]